MSSQQVKQILSSFRFRFTFSYVLLFTLLLGSATLFLRQMLANRLDHNIHDSLNREWAAMNGFLHIKDGMPEWVYDRDDPEQNLIVSELLSVYRLADSRGSVLQISEVYASLEDVGPKEMNARLQSQQPASLRVLKDDRGTAYLVRSGVIYSKDKRHDPYLAAIGRSLAENQKVVRQFTLACVGLMALLFAGGCLLGWLIPSESSR